MEEKQLEENYEQVHRPPNPRSQPSTLSVVSTDDDEPVLLDEGIPATIALETLAGPALILPETIDLDGRTLREEFDWTGKDEGDDEVEKKDDKKGALANSGLFICLSNNTAPIVWTCFILLALIFIAIDIAIFVAYNRREQVTLTSYGLQLWFTWIAFMWCISCMSQLLVEIVPWAIKKLVNLLRPQSTEVLRMRLSYYLALRTYIKLILITSWAWGAWALIRQHIQLPYLGLDANGLDMYQSEPSYVSTFYSVWEACFFAAIFLFVEKFILQLIVTSFHKKAYGDRIRDNDKALRILDRLKKMKRKNPQEFLLKRIRKKPAAKTPTRSHSLDEGGPNKSIMATQQEFLDQKSNVKFPSQNMDTLIAIPPLEDRKVQSDDEKQELSEVTTVESAPKRKSLFQKLKRNSKQPPMEESQDLQAPPPMNRENTWFSRTSHDGILGATRDFGISTSQIPGKLIKGGYQKFKSQTKRDSSNVRQTSSLQAKALAKKIFKNLLGSDTTRECIVESDMYPFFSSVQEATDAFQLFDCDGNGDVSKRELRSGCVRIYRERKYLSRSMRDLSQATGKLDIILMLIFIVVWVIIVCAAFGVNVGTDLMPLWSAFVAASFIFGGSAKDAFEAIIFVFVTHPFDAGDRVFIGTENWVVHEVGLLVTTFRKWDGTIVYVKNSVLTTQYIMNVRRSGRTCELNELQIAFSTPSWKIKNLISHMQEWSNEYPRLYTPNSTSCNVLAFKNQNLVSLSFCFEHSQNWQDPGGRWLRHNNFMFELKEECERLEIEYSLPTQPYENQPMDAPIESYNMGKNSSYGLDGLQPRKTFEYDNEERDPGGVGHGTTSSSNQADSGAAAGAAAALMFAGDLG
ncbi:hypothetical protein G6F56_001144 [Rhizopus delemar]|uniref:EF-hand domain-containing protein n=1 Tax=Rhizopus stolonifer TaxID=4846 RepID=A0A367KUK3_RHIST|nr:hypothetical protein G6F56_001144 [Rhizopus delemar]RCI05800.1 hypothetical protein CU098_007047 [Rhizopus stolonifer]